MRDEEVAVLGQSVICECGQRNDLAVFSYGEEKLCHACGRPLPAWREACLEEAFEAEVPLDAFADEDASEADMNSFESPSQLSIPQGGHPPQKPQSRVWGGGIRETAAEVEEGRCVRCGQTFRGAWDRQESTEGVLCHRCSVRADASYQAPTAEEKRELYRPVAPRKVIVPPPPEVSEAQLRKKKGLLTLAAVGAVLMLVVAVFPVEVWIAEFFSPDVERASDLPVVWHGVVMLLSFFVGALGQSVALYVTLEMMELLYEEPRDNLFPLAYLGIAFSIMDLLPFGMLGRLLFFVVKLLMISERFHLRAEGGVGFVILWFVCSLLLGFCMSMLDLLLRGVVAGIAL